MRIDFGCILPTVTISEIFEEVLQSPNLCYKYDITAIPPTSVVENKNNNLSLVVKIIDCKGSTGGLACSNIGTRMVLQPIEIDSKKCARYAHLKVSSIYDHNPLCDTIDEPTPDLFDENFIKDFFFIIQELQEQAIEKLNDLVNPKYQKQEVKQI